MTTKRERQLKIAKNRLERLVDQASTRFALNYAKAELASLERIKLYYLSMPADPQEDVWCGDLTEDIPSDTIVGTAEIPNNRDSNILIQPAYSDGHLYDQAADGQLVTGYNMRPYNAYYRRCIEPAWQKEKPTYRIATITDLAGSIASITLDPETGGEEDNIDINPQPSFAGVQIQYMNCDGAAFGVGDRVLVQFTAQDPTQPVIIGFEDNPQSCEVKGSFLFHTATYDDPISANFVNNRQAITVNAGAYVAADNIAIPESDYYWRSPDGKILSWGHYWNSLGGWLQPNHRLQHQLGNSSDPLVQDQNDYIFQDWKDPTGANNGQWSLDFTDYILEDGQQTVDFGTVAILGAGLITVSTQAFPTLIVIYNSSTEVRASCAVYNPANFPLTRATHFEDFASYDIGGWARSNFDGQNWNDWNDRQGPYYNAGPWKFNSDGYQAVALLWNELDQLEYPAGRSYRGWLRVSGINGTPAQGGTISGEFTVEPVGPIMDSQLSQYDRSEVLEVETYDLSYDGPKPEGYNLFLYTGDYSAAKRLKTTNEAITESEVIIGYEWDESDNLRQLSFYNRINRFDVTETTLSSWRPGTINDGSQFPDSALPNLIGVASGAPGGTTPPESGTAAAQDSASQILTDSYDDYTGIYKRDGQAFLTTSYREYGWDRTFDRQGDVAFLSAGPSGDQTISIVWMKASGAGKPWVIPARIDGPKGLFSYIEITETGWQLYATGSTGQTVPGTWDGGSDSAISWKYNVVDMNGGTTRATLDCGGAPSLKPGANPPADSLTVEEWSEEERWISFGTDWLGGTGYNVGDMIIHQDTRGNPTILKPQTFSHNTFPNGADDLGWINMYSNWGQFAPKCDFAENDGAIFICSEGIADTVNQARIMGGASGDPKTIIDTIIDPDIGSDPTIRFTPVIPYLGFPFSAYPPPETTLSSDDEASLLTDADEVEITN